MKKPLLTIFALLSVFAFYGCPNDDDPVKPTPIDTCQLYRDSAVQIKMFVRLNDTVVENDTFYYENYINFKAVGSSQYYEWDWLIADDTTHRNEKSFTLLFARPYSRTGNYSIRLIAKRPPMPQCGDDGIDTIYANMYLKYKKELSIFGDYFGSLDESPTDTFTVGIHLWNDSNNVQFININKGCDDADYNIPPYTFIDKYVSNNCIRFISDAYYNGCECPTGTVVLDRQCRNVIINYRTYVRETKSYIYHVYRGVKL